MKTAKIISFANHKGGVGKTTTTVSVGSALSIKGYKVLLVDMDAQANLTCSVSNGIFGYTIYHAMIGSCDLPIHPIAPRLDFVPASLQLAMADIELSTRMSREYILSELLKPYMSQYDYILIDCPPSLSLLTMNALTASTHIVIPLKPEVLPFIGLNMINQFVKRIQQHLNPSLCIIGILLTQWENTKITKMIEQSVRNVDTISVFKSKIRKNITLAEAPLEKSCIDKYAPKSNGAKDYEEFTKELLRYFKNAKSPAAPNNI